MDQWGRASGGNLANRTIKYPINFSIIYIGQATHILTSGKASGGDNNDILVLSSNSQVIVRVDDSVSHGDYLVIGK